MRVEPGGGVWGAALLQAVLTPADMALAVVRELAPRGTTVWGFLSVVTRLACLWEPQGEVGLVWARPPNVLIHTLTHSRCPHACTLTRSLSYKGTCALIHTHAHSDAHTCTPTHIHMHTSFTHMDTPTHIHSHGTIHTHLYAHSFTRSHVHTQTHSLQGLTGPFMVARSALGRQLGHRSHHHHHLQPCPGPGPSST